ncbi:MAG: ADP-glyceromanno-heptose 6-epimerase [Bdellovibrionaceae bacterium]|nr:ADP-glyceromanno-heptose 6-epimerase [Pseudobdellovibrionaceae bacterium]
MIIVTGSNGFIGSMIVWELNQEGFKNLTLVDSVDLKTRNLVKKRQFLHFLPKEALWDYLDSKEGAAVRWVIHMGACSSTTEKNWDFLKENNLEYTQKIWTWCAKNKKNLIYASSAATYGSGELGFDDHSDPEALKPLNLYGESKVQFDRWALKQGQCPQHWYGLRFFNVYGPHEAHKEGMASVAFKAYHQIKQNGELGLFKSYHPKYADGEQKRDFVYIRDITRWISELIELKPKNGVYNMGSGHSRTWRDLAKGVFSAMSIPEKIKWLEMPEDLKGQYQYFTEAKMEKLFTAGLSRPEWSLERGTEDYIRNFLSHEESSIY